MAGLLGVPEELLTRDNTDHICLTFNSETLPDNTHIMLCEEMRNMNLAEKNSNWNFFHETKHTF